MPSQTETKRRISDDGAKEHVDHRKRRRNRTTLSCLNCHGSKRMCDRRRPACGRCTKLGLSGTCVYEVDDINRRDPSQDEVLLLKNRIAELEGFIREFKRKPHPRTVVRKRRADSTASSTPGSDNGSDSDTCPDTGDTSAAKSTVRSPRSESSDSDNDPLTPSVRENEPMFLANQTRSASLLSSPGTSSNQFTELMAISDPSKTGVDCNMDIESAFDFGSSGLMSDGNDALDRVFARLMEQDARDMFTSNRDCGCVKQPPAYSAVLELAPHLRRALSALRSAPEHHTQLSEFGSPCNYLTQLQNLTDAISAIIESPPDTTVLASTSPLPCAPQSQRPTSNTLLSSTSCAEDSPLQRVLAARRAGLTSIPLLERSASQTPTIDPSKGSWKDASLRSIWGTPPNLDASVPPTAKDSFMSWEPVQRGSWPSTISL